MKAKNSFSLAFLALGLTLSGCTCSGGSLLSPNDAALDANKPNRGDPLDTAEGENNQGGGGGGGIKGDLMFLGFDQTFQNFPANVQPKQVITADLNGDSILDLITIRNSATKLSILLGNGDGTFQEFVEYNNLLSPITQAVTGDLDEDGNLDIMLATGSAFILVYLGQGDGTFGAVQQFSIPNAHHAIATTDLNGDIFQGNGNGTFAGPQNLNLGINSGSRLMAKDLDQDNNLDLIFTASNPGHKLSVLLGDGTGNFLPIVSYTTGSFPVDLVSEDFNLDGHPDIATANSNANNIAVFMNQGDGTLAAAVYYPSGRGTFGLATADLDQDGNLDLVSANPGNATIALLFGQASGQFQTAQLYCPSQTVSSLLVSDFNGDNKPDIAGLSNGTNSLAFLFARWGYGP